MNSDVYFGAYTSAFFVCSFRQFPSEEEAPGETGKGKRAEDRNATKDQKRKGEQGVRGAGERAIR